MFEIGTYKIDNGEHVDVIETYNNLVVLEFEERENVSVMHENSFLSYKPEKIS